ncbi:MAG: hypothetical protein ACRDXE_05310, partial [Acidimicrobiales bacterium]
MAERLSADAVAIIAALAPDGSTLGNIRLRRQLGLDAERCSGAAAELKALRLVVAGRGRGGSLALSDAGKSLQSQLVGEEPRPGLNESPTLPPPSPPIEPSRPGPKRTAASKSRAGRAGKGGPRGFEDALWKAADKLRGSMD